MGSGLDGAVPDGGTDGGGPTDGGADSGVGGGGGCAIGEIRCGDNCVDPDTSLEHCGVCDNPCTGMQLCIAGVCQAPPMCSDPFKICDGVCVNTSTDPDNCGDCDGRCQSGLCKGSSCAGAAAGHLVIVGHDYEVSDPTAMDRVAYNAMFVGLTASSLDVLTFQTATTTASVTGIDNAVDFWTTQVGTSWTKTVAAEDEVTDLLEDNNVFVVYPQQEATNADLAMWSAAWGAALWQFVNRGGVIVVFDGADAADDTVKNLGTFQVLDDAGFGGVTGRSDVSDSTLTVFRPSDTVVQGVTPIPYRGEMTTVSFTTSLGSDDSVVSVQPGGVQPVVIHRTFVPF